MYAINTIRWQSAGPHVQGLIFIPIETSGEGDVNAHSRCRWHLVKQKLAKLEFKRVIDEMDTQLKKLKLM
jgi:hypothetical protein